MDDLKITELTEETSPVGADLIPIVDDVAGTPTTKKCTLTNLAALMGTLAPGGNVTYNSVYASPPASPASGDLWFPPDSPYSLFGGLRYSGSAWVPTNGMTMPVDGDFTWVNQGPASVDTSKGGIYLSEGPAASSVNWRIRKKAAPSTPYTITAAMLHNILGVDTMSFGLGFREASSGKLAVNSMMFSSIFRRTSRYYTNETTFAGDGCATIHAPTGALIWFRITDNGTNRVMSYSGDGQNWLTHCTLGRTAFLTADEIWFGINVNNAAYGVGVTLLHWKET